MTKANNAQAASKKESQSKGNVKSSETSGNREESATGADNDKFGRQTSASSGTTPLGGSASEDGKPGPGGVEGTGGTT